MIYSLQEKIFSINEIRKMSYKELNELRYEINERIYWFLTTENYDSKKVKNLTSNEKKVNKVIMEMILK